MIIVRRLNINTKQLIVVRTDLKNIKGEKVRSGKIVAQCCHASMAFLTKRIKHCIDNEKLIPAIYVRESFLELKLRDEEKEWISNSFRKITCRVNSLEELMEIAKRAENSGLEVNIITDNGATEFNGNPTITCIAIGPDYDEKIDPITKELELY